MKLRGYLRTKIFPFAEMKYVLGGYRFETCLDVGAGSGIFLELLYNNGLIQRGTGIEIEQKYFRSINRDLSIVGEDSLKDQKFDLIMFNDVLHHVADPKKFVWKYLSAFLKENSFVMVKEMSDSHIIYKYFNRIHDLFFAGQWIKEVSRDYLTEQIFKEFEVIRSAEKKVLLYDHYCILFRAHGCEAASMSSNRPVR